MAEDLYNILFIENSTGSNPFKVQLDRVMDFKESLELLEWTITGIPLVTGTPEQLTAWLQMEGISQYSIVSNSTGRGMPLSMDRLFTHAIYNPPIQISRVGNKLKQSFEVTICNSNNTLLQFDQCTFKLRYK